MTEGGEFKTTVTLTDPGDDYQTTEVWATWFDGRYVRASAG